MDENATIRTAGRGFISDGGEIKHVDDTGLVDARALWGEAHTHVTICNKPDCKASWQTVLEGDEDNARFIGARPQP